MGWEVYKYPADEGLIADALYTSGKALFISNDFEMSCQDILRRTHLVALIGAPIRLEDIEADPARTLVRLFTRLPEQYKNLGRPLEDVLKMAPIREHQITALAKAEDARSAIAHEGADIGSLADFDLPRMCAFLRKLRSAVADLAAGDAVVSGWLSFIANKEPAASFMVDGYPDAVDRWVFGHIPPEWLEEDDADPKDATTGLTA